MEKEAKKEAFRKYLESSGVLDALTKGGPSISEYEKLQAEKSDLQLMYDELSTSYKEKCKEIEELKNSKVVIDAFIDRLDDKGMD
ncbi:hypothetical protein KFK09_021305 [Dendrobium nobile]|uniref:Uncharacterized protein n=1 Tax=Dendrobium nobile TaxID=94219 RepID=A0A8T3AQ09_DENNO|nr:hypothetical protein KFK09_021305 [Dendrobium nobile]